MDAKPEAGNGKLPSVEVSWTGAGVRFAGVTPAGHRVVVDEPEPLGTDQGARPTELLLVAAASCSGISAISLLKKMRQPVAGLRVVAFGERQPDWPKAFTSITLAFTVDLNGEGDAALIGKAVRLAVDRYCPVSATIQLGEGGCEVRHEVTIHRKSDQALSEQPVRESG